jgi:hypothetical protein
MNKHYHYLINMQRGKSLDKVPLLQLWVRSPRTVRKWKRFNSNLRLESETITRPIYRGTKLPWISGGMKHFRNKQHLLKSLQRAVSDFDNQVPVTIRYRPMSWTQKRSLANLFANEAKGHEIQPGVRLGTGFIHQIRPPVRGFDVFKQLLKLPLVRLPGSDELRVAKREREVLLTQGTVLIPVKRSGRIFTWSATT